MGSLLSGFAKSIPSNGLRVAFHRARGIRIGRDVFLGYDVNLDLSLPELIEIGDYARIGTGSMIFAHYVDSSDAGPQMRQAPVRIGRYATVYAGAIVMPGVTIGDHAIVRAGAVVEDDVPPYGIAAGVPARVVEYRPRPDASAAARERAMPP